MATGGTTNAWSSSQLVEYLAVLSEQPDEASARRAAVERVLESLEAEIGILFGPAAMPVVVGLPPDDPHVGTLVAAASHSTPVVVVDGLGPCRLAVVALNIDADPTRLLVARAGPAEFQPDEMLLLRGMAWVLALALRPLRVAAELNERRRVLEHTAGAQRAIAARRPLFEIFEMVTGGLLDLYGADLTTLHVADRDELVLVSARTTRPGIEPQTPARFPTGIAQQVYAREQPLRTDDYPTMPGAVPDLVASGASAAMGVPVSENGTVVGALAVMSFRPGHTFTEAQEQALRTFADQVSVAMSDARTLAAAQRATRDPVTGLPNRMYFLDTLQRALDSGVPVHVLFVDLDRFKLVNDTLGHAAGDDLLRQVGQRLRGCLRGGDLLARFGGDEYAVLMEHASGDEVARCGERVLVAVQEPYLIGPDEVVVGGSIGVADGDDHATASEVIRDADTAMYRAKHAGGCRLVEFEHSMHTAAVRRRSIEADLRRAVKARTLDVVFQPAVEMHSLRLRAAEALARWEHPHRGAVSPSDFIPLAEETGLIVPLGRHILALACAEAAAWQAARPGDQPPDVSVNISARQLLDASFVADLRRILEDTGLDPRRLVLEITESTIVSDLDTVLPLMDRLRDAGIRLSIDDFGTGYSSLSYLRMFPVDILKIDRSFVESIGPTWQGTAFIRAIVRLGEALSLDVVAEGVETLEQARALREVGCVVGQGCLFAAPMPPADFVAYIHRQQTGARRAG